MKRSEMLKKLAELIHANHYIDEADEQFPKSSLVLTKGQTNNILNGLEDLGMLPPTRIHDIPEEFDGMMDYNSSNTWESEDE